MSSDRISKMKAGQLWACLVLDASGYNIQVYTGSGVTLGGRRPYFTTVMRMMTTSAWQRSCYHGAVLFLCNVYGMRD